MKKINFSLHATILFNRDIKADTDRISPGGYEFTYGGSTSGTMRFDFEDSWMKVEASNRHILYCDQAHPDYVSFPEAENITAEMLENITGIEEWYIDTDTTDGSDPLIPVAILNAWIFYGESSEHRVKIEDKLLTGLLPLQQDIPALEKERKAMAFSCSEYSKVGLVIDMDDYDMVAGEIRSITKDTALSFAKLIETPDNTYLCMYWEFIQWDALARPLMGRLEHIRHTLVTVDADTGEVHKEYLESDDRGCDEEFRYLLHPNTDIMIWESDIPLAGGKEFLPLGRNRLIQLFKSYISNDYEGMASIRDLHEALDAAGFDSEEIEALGLTRLDEQRNAAEELRSLYRCGQSVELIYMDDPHAPPTGTKGIIRKIDDIGTIHVSWESGPELGLITSKDIFHIV